MVHSNKGEIKMDLIIKANNIDVEYNGKQILDIPELEIYSYDKIGIVGKNGVGKTTLLKILLEQVKIEGVKINSYGKVSYIPQLEQIQTLNVEKNAIMGKLKVHNIKGANISGGEETKLKIAKALSESSDVIFADEPTCNLDEESIKYITNSLKFFTGSIVVISHDRYFLDEVVNKIWEIKDEKIIEYCGNYTDYLNQKELEKQSHLKDYEQYISEKERLYKSMEIKLKQAGKIGKSKNKTEGGGRLAHQKSTGSKEKALHKSAKAIEQRIESLEHIEKPIKERQINFRLNSSLELYNSIQIFAEDLNKNFEDKVIFENAKFKIPVGSKVAITGGNGTGKTTLLKMILSNEKGIEIASKVQIGYFAQNGYKFEKEKNVLEFLKDESDYHASEIRSMIATMGIKQDVVSRKMGTLSGGEIVKILLCKMLLGKYNLLIMDEPNNFLDIDSITALEESMKQYKGTIIFVSHDKRLVENVAELIYEIKDYKLIER
jgi:macrolide transport system ATP-binding/permease protein